MSSETVTPLSDLSAFVISGRVKSHLVEPPEFETSVRTPPQGLADAVVKRPGSVGGSGYWIPIRGWSVRCAS
jgi:hypothetical protein